MFSGKVALITGGTSGIGKATALAFAREKARVVVAGRNTLAGEEVVGAIKKSDGEAIFVPTDITKEYDIQKMVDIAMNAYQRLDYAFNNAGTEQERPAPVEDFSVE